MKSAFLLGSIVSVLLLGCHSATQNVSLRHATREMNASDVTLLNEAVERYFAASAAKEMRDAVSQAKTLGPDTGAYHFIAADLARFDSRLEDQFDHVVQGARDSESDFALSCLRDVFGFSFTYDQRETARRLLTEIASNHTNPEMRDFAHYALVYHLQADGELKTAAKHARSFGWRLPFSIIGTWDNDQGKGFDAVFPPEEKIDLAGAYLGHYVNVGWRDDLVSEPNGVIDFTEMLYPSNWAVAYAVSTFNVKEAGAYELRVLTSDSMKIWINDGLVFSDRKVDGGGFDTVVIPISLTAGVNRVLVKSAQNSDSDWRLFARLTRTNGEAIDAVPFEPVKADSPVTSPADDMAEPFSVASLVERELFGLKEGSALKGIMRIRAADRAGQEILSIEAAENVLKTYPSSFRFKFELAMSLWGLGERAKANLALTDLFETYRGDFVLIGLRQAEFWKQNKLRRKARDLLIEITEKNPQSSDALIDLAGWYSDEEWTEDYCFIVEEINQKWKGWPLAERELASCYQNLDFDDLAKGIYQSTLKKIPYHYGSLSTLYNYAMNEEDFDAAGKYLDKLKAVWPEAISTLAKWAELNRQLRNFDEFRKTVLRIQRIIPDSPWSYERLAHLAYYQKNKEEAIRLWEKSLEKYPNDGDLEDRLSYLSPAKKEEWEADVPTQDEINALIARRNTIPVQPGTNIVFLIDDEVERLKVDGSTVSIITMVKHSLNMEGKDAITTNNIGCRGNTKVLFAYSVAPSGEIIDASTINGGRIAFKGLEVGATTVVQARCEESPSSMLGNYFSKGWAFQHLRTQFVDSRFVLWMPKDTKLQEFSRGDVKKEVSEQKDLTRISWSIKNSPVLLPENQMPSVQDFAWRLLVSTVPDWSVFYEWEQALLLDAFRTSPEIVALAERIEKSTETKAQRVRKIQAYLSTEIRYKREYEDPIAGVKPHPAPMVLSRGYGDCKDKAVLFMTLAKLMNIETRFALVRTRGAGQIIRETPSQQFNHAIVYVPKQEGIDEEGFYDPTADGLDVTTLHSADAGTWSLILDLKKRSFEWKEIAFQSADMNYDNRELVADINEDGAVSGTLTVSSQGGVAAKIRRISRNEERMTKTLQHIASSVVPGSTVEQPEKLDIDDVEKPISFSYPVRSETFSRKTDKKISFQIPSGISLDKFFVIDQRKYDIMLGAPFTQSWNMEFNLPEKTRKVSVPEDYRLETGCIAYSRAIKRSKKKVSIVQKIQFLCESIPAQDYNGYKDKVQKLRQIQEEEVVITLKK